MLSIRSVTIHSGNRALAGTLFDAAEGGASAAVVFVHGLASSRDGYVERARRTALATGARCLTFDMSGHGAQWQRFSEFSAREHLADVLSAYDYLARTEGVDIHRMGACGASYGAFLVALLAATRRPDRIILRAPALASDIKAPSVLPPGAGSDLDSIAAISAYEGNTLVIEMKDDRVIPRSTIERYLAASARTSHTIIKGGHTLDTPRANEEFLRLIVRYFTGL